MGVRSFRIELVSALILPTLERPRVLGKTRCGRASYGPLPQRFSEAWSVPRIIELYVCGRVVLCWRPAGWLPAVRAPSGTDPGYGPEMVAVLGPTKALPEALQRWLRPSEPLTAIPRPLTHPRRP